MDCVRPNRRVCAGISLCQVLGQAQLTHGRQNSGLLRMWAWEFPRVTGRDFVGCISFHCYKEIREWHLERKELYSGSWFRRCKVWGPHLVMAFFLAISSWHRSSQCRDKQCACLYLCGLSHLIKPPGLSHGSALLMTSFQTEHWSQTIYILSMAFM